MPMIDFVEDWLCYDTTLGEGAYGEVRLLVHKYTEEKIACKIINHSKYKNAATNIHKEVTIHKLLDHENIIKFFGRRQELTKEYLFLEYAAGGELFQLIEPDIGMPSSDAQNYMRQLLKGVSYLHGRGIAHRDIKPENLLLSADNVLKITDFGMATLFRFKGRERLLDKKCGTKPYLAPEVLKGPYRAQAADIWSCGIVLVAMLTGELPWSEPTVNSEEFNKWKNDLYLTESPWSKLGNTALGLARQILNLDPKKRATLEQIEKHPWIKFSIRNSIVDTSSTATSSDDSDCPQAKRFNSMAESETKLPSEVALVTLSQPVPSKSHANILREVNKINYVRPENVCFSQPTHYEDLMIQLKSSPVTKVTFHNLVKRLTRFYVKIGQEKAREALCAALDALYYTWTADVHGDVSISTVDLSKNQLSFKIILIDIDGRVLFDFRLSKGCGLQFKKNFLKIKSCLNEIIDESV